MKTLGATLLAVLAAGVAGAPRALAATPRLMVYYVEAAPAKAAAVAKALRAYASDAREKEGAAAPVIEVLRESGRSSRMAVVEQWRDLSPAKADARTRRSRPGSVGICRRPSTTASAILWRRSTSPSPPPACSMC
jgi:quinol monooxygenase YgiN